MSSYGEVVKVINAVREKGVDKIGLVDAFFADGIDDLYDFAVTHVDAALDIDDFVFFFLIRQRFFD